MGIFEGHKKVNLRKSNQCPLSSFTWASNRNERDKPKQGIHDHLRQNPATKGHL